MKVKLFLDTADMKQMKEFYESGKIQGITTNPSLIRQAGVQNYSEYVKTVSQAFPAMPLSLEVFADELDEMYEQAIKLAQLGKNIYVKIPITNTKGISTAPIVEKLSKEGVLLNITAIFTLEQAKQIISVLSPDVPAIISVFSGRIANAGVDPINICQSIVESAKHLPKCEVLWASSREALNAVHAEQSGCHIITMTPDLLKVVYGFGRDLVEFSLDTVRMFYNDAKMAGYEL